MTPPYPFRQFILKVHGRCDLACDYCYVYTLADQRWRNRPAAMSRHTMRLAAARIGEHATKHGLRRIDVVLHGGEPLLAGVADLEYCVNTVRAAVRPDIEVAFALQTNGIRLGGEQLAMCLRHGIRVGVSIDGGPAEHDLHRSRVSGAGSYAQAASAVLALRQPPYQELFGGLLCTIDLRNDPVSTYEALLSHRPPAIDFLLPHGNWSMPPPGRRPGSVETPYADWLIDVFNRWYHAPRKETRVRTFDEIIAVLLGGRSRVEGVGIEPSVIVVVETDGSIEGSDMLASAYEGAAATGLSVARDSFDTALRSPTFIAVQSGAGALSTDCHACRLHRVCGGGLYPHRFRRGSGFRNPSVYCPDLFQLIDHVRETLNSDLVNLRKRPR